MIKTAINDPLQEEMLVRKFNEECEKVAPSEYGFGEGAAMIYAAETEMAWNALMEQVGIAELKYYDKYGMLLNFSEAAEGEEDGDSAAEKASLKDKASNAMAAAKNKAGEAKEAAKAAGANFVKRVQEILEKIKQTILKLWKAAVEKFKSFDVANKAFIAKYKVALLGMKDKSFKIEEAVIIDKDGVEKAIGKLEGCESAMDKLIDAKAGSNPSAESLQKDLLQELFGAESAKSVIDKLIRTESIERTVKVAFEGLQEFGKKTTGAEKIQARATAAIDKFKKTVNVQTQSPQLKANLVKYVADMCKELCTAYINALKNEMAQNRTLCKQALASRVNDAKDKVDGAVQRGKDALKGNNGGAAAPAAAAESAKFNDMDLNSILESIRFA